MVFGSFMFSPVQVASPPLGPVRSSGHLGAFQGLKDAVDDIGSIWMFIATTIEIPTLPETNIAPESGWFPIGISSSRGPSSAANC